MRRLRMTGHLVLVAVAVLVCTAVAPAVAIADDGYTTVTPTVITVNQDKFWNYDAGTANYLPPRDPTKAIPDWPVTVIFTGNASVTKVRRIVAAMLPSVGSPIYLRLRDYPYAWQWAVDLGRKQSAVTLQNGKLVPNPLCLHIRTYARWGAYNSNGTWGKYVLCTTHFDYNEWGQVPGDKVRWSGLSELAEDQLANWFQSKGFAVSRDVFPLENAVYEPVPPPLGSGPVGDGHVWQSDGMATLIAIP